MPIQRTPQRSVKTPERVLEAVENYITRNTPKSSLIPQQTPSKRIQKQRTAKDTWQEDQEMCDHNMPTAFQASSEEDDSQFPEVCRKLQFPLSNKGTQNKDQAI